MPMYESVGQLGSGWAPAIASSQANPSPFFRRHPDWIDSMSRYPRVSSKSGRLRHVVGRRETS